MSAAPTFGEQLLRLAPSDIHIPERLGLFFPDKAAALGRLMAIHGQRTPITVRKSAKGIEQPWTLVTGMHRLSGALAEELPHVFALERVGVSAADALDEEASENLDRRDQPPLERAIFIHATCEAAKARLAVAHGSTGHGKLGAKARWAKAVAGEIRLDQAFQEDCDDACDTMSQAYGWAESVAAAFGRDKRTIYRALKLQRMLVEPFPELIQSLSDHPVVGGNEKQLLELASIERADLRRAAIEQLLGNPELSADEARVIVGIDAAPGRAPTPFEKFTNQISGGLGRLSAAEQKRALPTLLTTLKTDEVKRQLRDMLNTELGERAAGGATAALKSAFQVLTTLLDGEDGVDDETIAEATASVQRALFGIEGAGE